MDTQNQTNPNGGNNSSNPFNQNSGNTNNNAQNSSFQPIQKEVNNPSTSSTTFFSSDNSSLVGNTEKKVPSFLKNTNPVSIGATNQTETELDISTQEPKKMNEINQISAISSIKTNANTATIPTSTSNQIPVNQTSVPAPQIQKTTPFVSTSPNNSLPTEKTSPIQTITSNSIEKTIPKPAEIKPETNLNQNTIPQKNLNPQVPVQTQNLTNILSEENTNTNEIEQANSPKVETNQSTNNPSFDLDQILDLVIDQGASDLHISQGEKIALRIDGMIHFIENIPPLSKEKAEEIIFKGLFENKLKNIEKFKENKDDDFAYQHKDGTNFRINTFYKRGNISAVLRKINSNPFTFEQLGLPESVSKFVKAKSGLVLVCGPTGSGKSSTLAAMIEWINNNRYEHILTIEDPIEYIFESKKSIVSQREIGRDTQSFKNALRALLREDPDVAMIGELRDQETIMTAIELCETGHLVFGTFHTGSAAQTVNRLIANFPVESQDAVSTRLADSLVGVLCQRLVPRIGGGREGIFELVVANGAIRNLVRNKETSQLDSAIQTGSSSGMISMKRYAEQKKNQGLIKEEDYINFFSED